MNVIKPWLTGKSEDTTDKPASVGWLERRLVTRDDEIPKCADVAIAIGCALNPDGTAASPMSRANALRAAELFTQGRAQEVLLVGCGYRDSRHVTPVTEAEAMASVLAGRIPPEHLHLETRSYTTRRNADASLQIMREHGWTSAIVVAQQWHARRVRDTFRVHWPQEYQLCVIKAWSPYGPTNQWGLRSFPVFAIWDSLAFIFYKMTGDA